MAFWAGAALLLSGRVPVLLLEGDQQNQPQQRFPVGLPLLGRMQALRPPQGLPETQEDIGRQWRRDVKWLRLYRDQRPTGPSGFALWTGVVQDEA
jgi:hypothetical protein